MWDKKNSCRHQGQWRRGMQTSQKQRSEVEPGRQWVCRKGAFIFFITHCPALLVLHKLSLFCMRATDKQSSFDLEFTYQWILSSDFFLPVKEEESEQLGRHLAQPAMASPPQSVTCNSDQTNQKLWFRPGTHLNLFFFLVVFQLDWGRIWCQILTGANKTEHLSSRIYGVSFFPFPVLGMWFIYVQLYFYVIYETIHIKVQDFFSFVMKQFMW